MAVNNQERTADLMDISGLCNKLGERVSSSSENKWNIILVKREKNHWMVWL